MKPLKRFTQCGSLTMLFAVFIVLFGVSSTALTTFGKTNPNPPPATQGPLVKGRECNNHQECSTLHSTSCVKDPYDSKLRCLCGDNTAPINGLCQHQTAKSLHHLCDKNSDCDEYMVCTNPNKTKAGVTPGNSGTGGATFSSAKFPSSSNNKHGYECMCDEANGYIEDTDDSTCNGGIVYAINTYLMSVIAFLFIFPSASFLLSTNKMQY